MFLIHLLKQGGENKQMGLHQPKIFCKAKETINKMKKLPTEWENTFANDIYDKGLISQMYEGLIKLNTKKTNNPIQKWAMDMNRHTDDIQMAKEMMLNVSNHLKNADYNHSEILTPVRMAIINQSTNSKCW